MILRKSIVYLTIILLALISFSCESENTLTPTVSIEREQLLNSIVKHKESAFEVYPRAKEEAKRWNDQAILYQIPPTRLMEGNFGLSGGGPPGWFFMFKDPDSPVELFVEIVDGKLYGKTEAQPIIIGEPKYKLNPIEMDSNLLDSDDALNIYLDDGGDEFFLNNPDVELDYRLVFLEGIEHPIWSIFDVSDFTTPLYNVDAITGEKTTNPYQSVE